MSPIAHRCDATLLMAHDAKIVIDVSRSNYVWRIPLAAAPLVPPQRRFCLLSFALRRVGDSPFAPR
jgi:hypothetical protein